MNPKNISIQEFTYTLPDEKIAKHPLQKRDESKLLIYKHGQIKESVYYKLYEEIDENSLLIFNNTKVVEARLLFSKNTGSIIEIFCLEPANIYADITTAMLSKEKVLWKCLVGGAKKWKEDLLSISIKTDETTLMLTAKKIKKHNDYFLIEFNWNNNQISFAEVLHLVGEIPLPPYLNRAVEDCDKDAYQTVYAKHKGSVAAPTAGLHFTNNLLNSLKNKNINNDFVTLHVGAGTFKPVKANELINHEMHSEFIEINITTIENILANLNNKIVAVGTTSLRTIESLYWIGVKILMQNSISENDVLDIKQWDCYELPQNFEAKESLNAVVNWLKLNNKKRLFAKTQIIIAPGYLLKIADGLITNFHQPNSTLLLLIASIIGNNWKEVYDYALNNNFRFLSYGDGSLLWKK